MIEVRRGAAGCGAIVLLVLVTSIADAQPRRPRAPREPRVFVTIGGGVQAGSEATDRLEWDEDFETAVADVSYAGGSSRWLRGGVGMRLWRQIGAGVAFSSTRRDGTASVEGRIPHPFFFGEPREISGETGLLTRSETGLHLQVLYIVPATGRLRIMLGAGPSRVSVRQDAVTLVRYTDAYPFDTAAFQRADTRSLRASALGVHAGADAAYMLTRTLGLSGLVRVTRASIGLTRPDGGRLSLDAGGVQAGGGLQVLF